MSEELVKKLVENGASEEEAKEKIAKMEELLKGMPEEEKLSLMKRRVSMTRKVSGTEVEVTVLGPGLVSDANSYAKYTALQAYKEDPDSAIEQRIVELRGEDVVPLDVREFWDEEGTKKNKNFGKPIQTRMQRTTVGLLGDKLVNLYGTEEGFEPTVGVVNLTGTVREKSITGIRNVKPVSELPTDVFTRTIEAVYGTISSDIDSLEEKKNKTVAVFGSIADSGEMSSGGVWFRISNFDSASTVVVFASNMDSVPEVMTNVICIGKVQVGKDGDPTMKMLALVEDKTSKVPQKTLDMLNELEL